MVEHDGQHDGLDRLIRSSLAAGNGGDAGACPEADTVAAYGENRLGTEERRSLEVHLAACARCQDVLALIARDALRPPEIAGARPLSSTRRPWFLRLRWAVPAASAAVAVTIYVAVRPHLSGTPDVAQAPPVATMAGRLDSPTAALPSPPRDVPVERAGAANISPPVTTEKGRLAPTPAASTTPPPHSPSGRAVSDEAAGVSVFLAGSAPAAESKGGVLRESTQVGVSARSRPAAADATPAAPLLSPDTAMTKTSPFETVFTVADVVVLARAHEPAGDGTPFEVVEVFKRPNDVPPAGWIVLRVTTGSVQPDEQYLLFLRRREPADTVLEPLAERGVVRVGDTSGPLLAFLRQLAGTTRR